MTTKKKGSSISVEKVAKVARIDLTEAEIKKFQKDLEGILDAFKEISKLDPKLEPAFQPLPVEDVVRKDELEVCLGQEKALANTKHKEKGFFKGPRVV